MSFWEAFFANLPAFFVALGAFIKSLQNGQQIETVRKQTNSVVHQLGEEAHERGRLAGIEEGKAEQQKDGSGDGPCRKGN